MPFFCALTDVSSSSWMIVFVLPTQIPTSSTCFIFISFNRYEGYIACDQTPTSSSQDKTKKNSCISL
ncbi:Uncharacterized protein APZ42_029618 [Daphnia magna]|uniref:Uncharacterized protein n=1 Tax=Daphnia magna TaxID=35525 RepID=A0A164PG79_9CRUS|nr:Uncharacterized protein APZ42_029618 [Daphnia magna]